MSIEKITQLKKWMDAAEIDWSYISDPSHIHYFTGFHSEPHERVLALFVPLNSPPFLFVPALEVEEAQKNTQDLAIIGYLDRENPWDIIVHEILKKTPQPKSFALEKNALTLDRYEALAQRLPDVTFSEDLTPLIQRMQLQKTPQEKAIMLEAGHWADVAFEIGFKMIHEGISEQEIVAEIEYQLKKQGVTSMSFDTIVLAGSNAASPHGEPGTNKIQKNELVLFDLGVIWKGYCSDATRTVSYHEPTDLQAKIHKIVLEAQIEATKAIKPGVKASAIDKIARDVISSYGYDAYFNHRLGHGIGTTVHEFPSIVEGNDLLIEEGMCFSIEPGIYIPNQVGVRIEDCIYVNKNGAENFTKTPKSLQIIN